MTTAFIGPRFCGSLVMVRPVGLFGRENKHTPVVAPTWTVFACRSFAASLQCGPDCDLGSIPVDFGWLRRRGGEVSIKLVLLFYAVAHRLVK